MSIFEKLTIIKKINFIFYWILIGILFFIIQEILFYIILKKDYNYSFFRMFVIFGGFTLYPIIGYYLSKKYKSSYLGLKSVLTELNFNYDKYIFDNYNKIFTYKSKSTIFIILIITLFVYVSLFSYKLPYDNYLINLIFIIFLFPYIFWGSHGAYLVVKILYDLYLISKLNFSLPFFCIKHTSISKLNQLYSRSSFIVLVVFFFISYSLIISPYNLSNISLFWMFVLSFFPLAMFLFTFYIFYFISSKIKRKHLESINEQIQIYFKKIKKTPKENDVKTLSELIDIQRKVNSLRIWPISIENILTFLMTTLTPLINIFLKKII